MFANLSGQSKQLDLICYFRSSCSIFMILSCKFFLNQMKIHPLRTMTPQAQGVNWTYIWRSEDVLDVFWTFYVRSIYVLCLLGMLLSSDNYIIDTKIFLCKCKRSYNQSITKQFISFMLMQIFYVFPTNLLAK